MSTRTKLNEVDTERIRENRMVEWEHFRAFGTHFDLMPSVLGISRKEWLDTYFAAQKQGDPRAVGRPDAFGRELGRPGALRRGRLVFPKGPRR